MVKNFVHALQFLTIVRVSNKYEIKEGDLAKSMVYFPVIGFLLGVVLVNVDQLMLLIALPQGIANFLLIALLTLLTRALHVDGLADTLDGLMGGKDQSSRLAIMKDSRIGTAGVIGVVFVLMLKYLSLNTLLNSEKVAVLLTAPMLARWSQTIMAYKGNYAREEGMAKAFVGHLRASGMAYASVIAVCFTSFVVLREDVRALFLIISVITGVVAWTLLSRWYLVRKLGGISGDAIGAVSETNEVLVFLLFVVFAGVS